MQQGCSLGPCLLATRTLSQAEPCNHQILARALGPVGCLSQKRSVEGASRIEEHPGSGEGVTAGV